ncbi:hypothetical protein B9Z55_014295 [Caenorhabditis nigoni]|uniref:Lipase n=1 Tax=Caenorhabditis nigoni TaxID=1611254 RepID=A0A2G5U5B6_9PELO|nr:hypothetical protein B9Z55_014295 [Caenorhabditis nigoni]
MRINIFLTLLFLFTTETLAIDEECYMTVPEIGKRFGYDSEVHLVRTTDEYILELHRFPCKNNEKCDTKSKRPIVFLQHGLLADGFSWIPNLANQSAGFVFADAGFDVWIANSRGTPASQKHIGYGPENQKFWNFTWQQMSEFDLTSSVDYVLKETKQEFLYYLGHSQGTMIMFSRLAENPEFAKKIRHFHALAPVATVSHIGGLFGLFGKQFLTYAEILLGRLPYTPLSIPRPIQKMISYMCSKFLMQNICTLDIGFIDGNEKQFNQSRVGVYLCHTPAATSVKDLQHWIQLVESQKVAKFDYGPVGNQLEYGQPTPPVYDLTQINIPTYLYWSRDDILADTQDIRDSILSKMNKTIAGSIELPHYSHMDFVFGINAAKDLYPGIIKTIQDDFDKYRISEMHKLNKYV